MGQESDAQAEHLGLEALDQLPDGLRLAQQAASHQSGVVG